MKIEVKAKALGDELAVAARIAAKKETMPALQWAHVTADGADGARVVSTDQDISVRASFAARVSGDAAGLLLPTKRVLELTRQLPPDADLTIELSGKELLLRAGSYKGRLQALPASEFPVVAAAPAGPAIVLPSAALKAALMQVRFASTEQDKRYSLDGAKLDVSATGFAVIATDSHRLALATAARTVEGATLSVLLGRKVVGELPALLECGDEVAISESENMLFFSCGDRELIGVKTVGVFPDHTRVRPKGCDKTATVSRLALAGAAKRVALVSDGLTIQTIALTLRPGEILVSARGEQVGESDERVPCEYKGPEVGIKFKSQYMLDFLDAAMSESVAVNLKDDVTGAIWQQLANDVTSYEYILMPVRL